MRLLLLPIFGLLIGAASAADKDPARKHSATIVYNTVFLNNEEKKWTDMVIEREVSAQTLKSIPETDGKFAMIGLDCDKLDPVGRLSKCRIHTDPKTSELKSLGERIAKDIRAEKAFAQSVQGDVKFVSLQLRVTNTNKPTFGGPCWPPSCNFVPAPPLPPPPQEKAPH